jgi:hypothetical protein
MEAKIPSSINSEISWNGFLPRAVAKSRTTIGDRSCRGCSWGSAEPLSLAVVDSASAGASSCGAVAEALGGLIDLGPDTGGGFTGIGPVAGACLMTGGFTSGGPSARTGASSLTGSGLMSVRRTGPLPGAGVLAGLGGTAGKGPRLTTAPTRGRGGGVLPGGSGGRTREANSA